MTNKWINTPAELEALPDGTQINDSGLIATKVGGAWQYWRDDRFWEPEHFPVKVMYRP